MAVVLQAIALISEPPGSYVYQVLLLCVLAAIAARSAVVGAKRLTLAFCGLAGLRLGALIISLLTRDLPLYQLVIIPPFDRAVAWLTIFGLIWALTYPHSGQLSYNLAAAAALLTSAAAVVSWVLWIDAVGKGSVYYNGTLQDSLWLIAQLFLLIGGMVVLLRQRLAGWQAGLGLLVILFVSEVLHYLFPIADANVPGFVRFAELIVWPLAAVMLWRRPLSEPGPDALADGEVALPGQRMPSGATVEMLQAELDAANRRNQQLRETHRQARQQLAEAAAALAEASQVRATTDSSKLDKLELARAELAQERAAREQAEAAAQGLVARVASMETALSANAGKAEEFEAVLPVVQSQAQQIAQLEEQLAEREARLQEQAAETLLAAGDKSSEAAYLAEELNAVRLTAQSHAQQIANLDEQLREAQAQQQEQALAGQAVDARLADSQANVHALTEQLEQLRAELAASESKLAQEGQTGASLRVELRDSQAALTEARRTSDRAQAQLSEQAIQLGVLQQQVAHLERLASDRRGHQVERRRPATSAAVNEDSLAAKGPRRPKNVAPAAGGNGQKGNSAAAHLPSLNPANLLAVELRPELTPTIAGPVCTHLGLQSDHATRHAFPSEANRCFGLASPAELSFEQQRSYCLTGAHVKCPIFTGQLLHPAIPIDTSPAPPPEPQTGKGLGRRMGRFFRRQP